MSNFLRRIQRNQQGAVAPLPGRMFERTAGCWNCQNWQNGQPALQHWLTSAKPRDEANALRAEIEGNAVLAENTRKMIAGSERAIRAGAFGLCKISKPSSDYVEHAYLCDGWTGRTGANEAREGARIDLLPEELKERVDGE